VLPSRRLLALALVVAASLSAVAALGWFVSGTVAVVGVVLGFLVGVPAAITVLPRRWLLASGAVSTLAAVTGAAVGDTWPAVALVLVAGLLQAPANRVAPGSLVMLPVVVAVAASAAPPGAPWLLGLWVAVGHLAVALTAAVLGLRFPATPVPPSVARRYAVAVALVGAGTLAAAQAADLPHGYWMVVTAVAVLRPFPRESSRAAVDRVVGTVAGLVLAVAIAVLLPTAMALVAAAAGLLMAVAWAASGDQRRSTGYAAPVIVLAGSSGLAGQEIDIAVERLVLTLVGTLVAVGAALLLQRGRTDTPDADRAGTATSAGREE
jgi:hypothetical protein